MCKSNPFPQITWNETAPGFHLKTITAGADSTKIRSILDADYIYELGSFMGCSCGLMYNTQLKEDDAENYPARIKDAAASRSYLKQHLSDNKLKLFATWWKSHSNSYSKDFLSLSVIDMHTFEIPEDVVLTVTE